MTIPWIDADTPLPFAENAQKHGSPLAGLVAAGGDLSVNRLCEAYRGGIFPWFSDGQPVLWWSPDPRMVLLVNEFKLHRSLRKTIQAFRTQPGCELRVDSAFEQTIRLCASTPRQGQSGTWIVPAMIEAYIELHQAGFAHSFETWVDQKLVGGLYCVSLGDTIFGESMFSTQKDASKIALAGLVTFARARQLQWIDCQQNTKHLSSLGAKEIPRSTFISWIHQAPRDTSYSWNFDSNEWKHLMSQVNP